MKKYKVFLYSGLLGMLIDLDHTFMLIKEGLPITLTNMNDNGSRLLHLPILYALAIYATITVIAYIISLGKDAGKER